MCDCLCGEGDGTETRLEAAGREVGRCARPEGRWGRTHEPDSGPERAEDVGEGEGQRHEGLERAEERERGRGDDVWELLLLLVLGNAVE